MKLINLCIVLFLLLFFYGCESVPVDTVSLAETVVIEETSELEDEAETEPEVVPEAVVIIENVGLVVKEVSSSGGFVDEYRNVEYRPEGVSILREELFNSFDELLESVVYEYDEDLNTGRIVFDPAGNVISSKKFHYNMFDLIVRDETYNDADKLQLVSIYEYDEDLNKIKWSVLNDAEQLLSYTVYLYDNGKNVSIENFTPAGKKEESFSLEYDSDGILLKYSSLDSTGKLETYIEYTVFEGLLMEENFFLGNGFLREKIQYRYNDEGSIVDEILLDGNGNVSKEITREFIYREIERIVYE